MLRLCNTQQDQNAADRQLLKCKKIAIYIIAF
jgi:hypothetical protein